MWVDPQGGGCACTNGIFQDCSDYTVRFLIPVSPAIEACYPKAGYVLAQSPSPSPSVSPSRAARSPSPAPWGGTDALNTARRVLIGGQLIGTIIGGLLMAALVVFFVWRGRRQRKMAKKMAKQMKRQQQAQMQMAHAGMMHVPGTVMTTAYAPVGASVLNPLGMPPQQQMGAGVGAGVYATPAYPGADPHFPAPNAPRY
jgi:hypothetical protein